MNRKLKMICVACAAAFALTAVSASSAMATTSGFTVGTGGTSVQGTQTAAQKWVFGAGGTTIKCSTSTLVANVSAGLIHEITATPAYSGCTLAGLAMTVNVHSCTWTITDTATANTYDLDWTNCPTTSPETFTVASTGCVVTISNQGPLLDLDASNNTTTSPDDVDLTLTIKETGYTGNASCPANLVGSHTDGQITGGYTLKAFNGATQVNITTD